MPLKDSNWTKRMVSLQSLPRECSRDATMMYHKITNIIKDKGLRLVLEAIITYINDIIESEEADRHKNTDYLYKLKYNLEKTLEDYKNRYKA